jgi:hypothetical protein
MPNFRLFTPNQLMIYQDHHVESQSYDTVSMFGMRSPELVSVFQQTKPFIRCCYVDEKIIPDDIHASLLNRDISKCRWVSLLSQRVYIRFNAVDEVDRLVDSNLAYLNSSDNINGSRTQFYHQSNHPTSISFAFLSHIVPTLMEMIYCSRMNIQMISSTMMVCCCVRYLFQ